MEIEEVSEVKHEYHAGRIIAMAGGTSNHCLITNSFGTELNSAARKSSENCRTYSSDMKVWIPNCRKGVYPDLSVVCGEPQYTTHRKTVLKNPMLIIEVLSQSTKNDDKGMKFECYRSLPSFKEYVIVYQTIPRIETWYKEATNLWRISSAFGLEDSIYIHTLDTKLALKDIYEYVEDLNLDKDVIVSDVY